MDEKDLKDIANKILEYRIDIKQTEIFLNVQKNHWQCMCDLSDNDYDIHYFEGRECIDDEIITYLRNCDGNLIHFFDYINSFIVEIQEEYDKYIENGFADVHRQGCLDEIKLAYKIIKQEYT